jgi:uncharacterized protein YoxC
MQKGYLGFQVISIAVAVAAIVAILLIWPKNISSQPYQSSKANSLAPMNQKLDRLLANQGQMMSKLDRIWQDVRRVRR